MQMISTSLPYRWWCWSKDRD